MKKPSWYKLLEILRSVRGEINSRILSDRADLDAKDASAWLCKLTRYGYLRRLGRSELGGKMIRYELTKYGVNVKVPRAKRSFGTGQLRIAANPEA